MQLAGYIKGQLLLPLKWSSPKTRSGSVGTRRQQYLCNPDRSAAESIAWWYTLRSALRLGSL